MNLFNLIIIIHVGVCGHVCGWMCVWSGGMCVLDSCVHVGVVYVIVCVIMCACVSLGVRACVHTFV